MKIALAGNPNSGKTTMFNALTGQNEKTGNWAGVTVEKSERPIKKSFCPAGMKLTAVDLPGTFSMSPFTGEECVTRDYIQKENPDVIINIVDATNLSRSLFFTTQLLELGIPVVVALNKIDRSDKKGRRIDQKLLSEKLGCPVRGTVSTAKHGLEELLEAAVAVGTGTEKPQRKSSFVRKEKFDDRERFRRVEKMVKEVETRLTQTDTKRLCDRIDALLLNKWIGIPVFSFVLWLVFQISLVWTVPFVSDLPARWLERAQNQVALLFQDADPFLCALLVDGVIGGVIAVIKFLPLVMIMVFLIALLEDCGYLARVSALFDPIFKKIGLSGKSVIPFVLSVGCAVPGVMASRTIKDERERRAAVMLAPFMPCGAKMTVIALFAGAFFENAGWVTTLMYFLAVFLIFFFARVIVAITGVRRKTSFFIMELPDYKFPSVSGALRTMTERGKAFLTKAATVILLSNVLIQTMQSFDWNLSRAVPNSSILASVASPLACLLVPIVGGYFWQLAAACVTGFLAKENVVATLAVCYSLQNLASSEGGAFTASIGLTKVAALSYLIFNLFTPPCAAAIGAMHTEMKSKKWLWGGIGLQFGAGYTLSFLVYTIGTLLTSPRTLSVPCAIAGFCMVLSFAGILCALIFDTGRKRKKLGKTA